MAESQQLTYDQLVEEYNKQHLLIYTQQALIHQLEKNLVTANSQVEKFHDQMRNAKHILDGQEEVISQLDKEITHLEGLVEKYKKPEPLNLNWTEEDDVRDSFQPSWTFMKPYNKILASLDELYPSLWYNIRMGFQAERQRWRELYEVERKLQVTEVVEETQQEESTPRNVDAQPLSTHEVETHSTHQSQEEMSTQSSQIVGTEEMINMIDDLVDNTATTPHILQITLSSDELSDTSIDQDDDPKATDSTTSDEELIADDTTSDDESVVSHAGQLRSSPIQQDIDDTSSQLPSIDPTNNIPSDLPHSSYVQSDSDNQRETSKTPQERVSSSPVGQKENVTRRRSTSSEADSFNTDDLLPGFPSFPYRDVPHFVLDDNLFRSKYSSSRRPSPYAKASTTRNSRYQSTNRTQTKPRHSTVRRHPSPQPFESNRPQHPKSSNPHSCRESPSPKLPTSPRPNRTQHDDSFQSQPSQRSRSPRNSPRSSHPPQHQHPPHHKKSAHGSRSSSGIPSLLNITVERPAEVSPHLEEWLRRNSRPGCWNCGDYGHRFAECPIPKSKDQKFCHCCGDSIPRKGRCRNCYLTTKMKY